MTDKPDFPDNAVPRASRWPDSAELAARLERARQMLRHCDLCELHCGVDRLAGERARCKLAAETHVYKTYVSLNEEPGLRPALRVFLGGCNFRCPWCDEAPDAFDDAGVMLQPREWAARLLAALDDGVRVISVLGGEPTLHVPALLEIAVAAERPLALALNSNMYMTPSVLDLLDGVVQYYLADFKFGNDDCARRYAGVPNYVAIVTRNLLHATSKAHAIVRHVLMPGHFDCCFRPAAEWVTTHLPGIRFQLYPGYVPCGRAALDAQVGRLNSRAEVAAAYDYLAKLGLRSEALPPMATRLAARTAAGETGVARVTIGTDGRLYCHDLTPTLASLLSTFCPPETANAADLVQLRHPHTAGSPTR